MNGSSYFESVQVPMHDSGMPVEIPIHLQAEELVGQNQPKSDSDGKRLNSDDEPQDMEVDGEAITGKGTDQKTIKSPTEPPKDYIHILARIDQGTDSLSLAEKERARREKIKERLRIIQDLVPGCNQVSKTLVLDDIIKYIQSLQQLVESDCDGKQLRTSGSGDESQNLKADGEANSGTGVEEKTKLLADSEEDYIHVRAGRGRATGTYSPAEKARREKINEQMRIIQDLVPGSNKIIGKTRLLDEVINYIQSLQQRQVQFLSMKFEAANLGNMPGIEGFPAKDFGQHSTSI